MISGFFNTCYTDMALFFRKPYSTEEKNRVKLAAFRALFAVGMALSTLTTIKLTIVLAAGFKPFALCPLVLNIVTFVICHDAFIMLRNLSNHMDEFDSNMNHNGNIVRLQRIVSEDTLLERFWKNIVAKM